VSTPRGDGLAVVLAVGFVPLAAFVLVAAACMPMSYDDAYNATVPLNLLRGKGYSTSFPGPARFDPEISSGAAFLAPAAVPMALFGAGMRSPMLYTGLLSLALYLFLLRSLHEHAPRAALSTALLVPFTLWHGKNDTVVMESALPPPPFGYWYQLLGNLPGLLALALAMSLLLERRPLNAGRALVVAALTFFAVNAKAMHAVPLAAMVLLFVMLPADASDGSAAAPSRRGRVAIALGLLAAGWCGLRFNRGLAWLFLDGQAFRGFADRETASLARASGMTGLLSIAPARLPLWLLRTVTWNALRAVQFLGGAVQGTMIVAALVATALAAWRAVRRCPLARLTLVLLAGAGAHLAWWACAPSHPTRRLTAVAGLACFALAGGLALWHGARDANPARRRPRARIWWGALGLLCAAGAPNLLAALGGWSALREYRNEQHGAAAALERLAAAHPDAAFCSPGWYVPRELTYLAPDGVRYCDLNAVGSAAPGRRILMRSSTLWPELRRDTVRAAGARCTVALERVGRFEFRGCDGFRRG
jgi:hypothetical protein